MSYDTIIVGLGTFGSAAAAALAARGRRVLGLEQFGIPNARGSHHGHSRVFRTAYFEHPDYVPLLQTSHRAWVELDRREGGGLFFQTGAIYAGPSGCMTIEGALGSARAHGLDAGLVSEGQVRSRWPQFRQPQGFDVLWESCAGVIVPELAVSAFARGALSNGAELRGHEPVLGWSADDDGVRVRTDRGEYRAGSLVFAAGAWSERVIRDLGVPLQVARQVLAWYWPRRPELFQMPRHPVWAVENEQGLFHYGFPMLSSWPGMKVALHGHGPTVDPDLVGAGPLPGDEAQTREAVRRYFPDADGPLLSLCACLYTNSPDGHFVLDLHPEHRNVAIMCGSSGHGFKFAPVIGEVLADLAIHGSTSHPVGFLGLARFGGASGGSKA